ncbi:maleylpyruvate isomerase N-terminal domain-containing protein [Georgenia sp. 10Sc9-8]|uniref:Maleylpyruvate isomerase N-terminal domain-containing protein n=1 Tax=Georgenia halotolerans TaxID=3028317 RepID=A0ABT5U0I5_9MICO|nr:maleylpyruvate isomerase N-terminal domain-containing protein [Georgenia halotolerans]
MDTVREAFTEAAEAFVSAVADLTTDDWDLPGLGEWSVRDLVGHTSRALSTAAACLDRPTAGVQIPDAAAYYATAASAVDPRDVADRGRAAGVALGADPVATVTDLAARSVARVAAAPHGLTVTTVVGGMRFEDYLQTRVLELTVHGLDLLVATGQQPQLPDRPLRLTLHLLAELALRAGTGSDVALSLAGRRGLPPGFSVL